MSGMYLQDKGEDMSGRVPKKVMHLTELEHPEIIPR